MNIWIDADTGSYGVADDLWMITINDKANIGDFLDSLDSIQLAQFARGIGTKVPDWLYYGSNAHREN